MKASDLFIRCLENEGVEYIFGVPGEENADIMISLLDSSIKFIVCRHEQGAAFIADVYGRLTGRPGVCLGTLGPGATNLITGVADADMDRAPLVVLTGQGSTSRLHKESHQAMDVVSMFRPIVKWTTTVANADSIPEIIRKAFKLAETEKTGAVHIELPEDVAKHRTLSEPLTPQHPELAEPNSRLIQKAADTLSQAEFPVILAGNGVLRNRASEQLTALVDKTGIPVINTFMGKGVIPASHPCSLFTVGLGTRDIVAGAVEESDVVLVLGYDMVEYHPKLWNRGKPKTIINIDSVPSEVDADFQPSIEIAADLTQSLDRLCECLPAKPLAQKEQYDKYRQSMLNEFSEHAEDTAYPVKPQKILWEVRKAMAPSDILLSDVGAHKMWVARYFQCDVPNTCLISNGFCSMGFALPGAIGAKLSFPDRKVVAICGDGGFMMNVQDLETAVRLKLPMVIMVWTDSQYGLIKWKQEAGHGQHSHIDFDNPDFMKLADAFGCVGLKVNNTEELPGILAKALEVDGPVLVECPVDYSENMKLSRRLGEMSSEQRTSWLKRASIFGRCNSDHLQLIADAMVERSYAPSETIFNQGDAGDEVFLLVEGEAEVHIEDNGKTVVHEIYPGGCLGEMAILADQPRSGTVVSGKNGAEMLVLDGTHFREILLNQPGIGLELLSIMTQRLVEKDKVSAK